MTGWGVGNIAPIVIIVDVITAIVIIIAIVVVVAEIERRTKLLKNSIF